VSAGLVPRRFTLERHQDETGISGTGTVAWGLWFPDSRCVLRWTTSTASTAVYDSLDDVRAIHGHEGKTEVRWLDDPAW
jgi:hypothetical protein